MKEKKNIFEKIPTDVLFNILNNLNLNNLSQLTRTCKYLYSIIQNKYPWHNQLIRMFGIVSCKEENAQLSIKLIQDFENNFNDCFTITRENRSLLEGKFSNLFKNGETWAGVYSTYIRLTDPEFELKDNAQILPLLIAIKLGLEYFKSNEKQLSDRFLYLLRVSLINFSSSIFSHFNEHRENYQNSLQNDFNMMRTDLKDFDATCSAEILVKLNQYLNMYSHKSFDDYRENYQENLLNDFNRMLSELNDVDKAFRKQLQVKFNQDINMYSHSRFINEQAIEENDNITFKIKSFLHLVILHKLIPIIEQCSDQASKFTVLNENPHYAFLTTHIKIVREQVSILKSNLEDELNSNNFNLLNYVQVILDSYKNQLDLLTSFPDDLMNYCKKNDSKNFEKIQSEYANIKSNLNDLKSHYNRYERVIDIARVLLSLVQVFKLIQPHVEAYKADQPVIMGISYE